MPNNTTIIGSKFSGAVRTIFSEESIHRTFTIIDKVDNYWRGSHSMTVYIICDCDSYMINIIKVHELAYCQASNK